jgi:hypothetical protein
MENRSCRCVLPGADLAAYEFFLRFVCEALDW